MENKVLSVFFGSDLLPYKDSERTVHYPITGNAFAGSHNTNEIHFYVDEIGGTSGVSWVIVSKLPNGKLGYEPLSNVASDSDLGEDYLIFDLSSYYTQYKGVVKLALRGYQGTITFDYDSDSGTYTISGDPLIEVTGTIDLAINYSPFVNTGSISQDNVTQIIAAMSNYLLSANGIVVVSSLPSDLSGYNEGQVFYNKSDGLYYIYSSGSLVEYEQMNVTPITTYDYSDTALQGIEINGTEYRLAQLGTVNSNYDLAIGRSSRASSSSIALGYGSSALSAGSIAIGGNSGVPSDNNYGIAIGHTAQATEPYSIAIGFNAVNDASNSIVIGDSAENYIPRTISFDSTDQVANYQKTLVWYSPEKIFFRNDFIDSSYTSLDDYTNGQTLQDLLDTYVDLTSTQTISGQKTFSGRAIFSGYANLYNSYLDTNNKNYFARVGITTNQYVTYKLPYNYSDVGATTYTLATIEDVNSAISTLKANAFIVVDYTDTYPTLDDFLASSGEEGYIYLYPIDTSDLTQGYYQYIWESSAWLSIGTTIIDLSDYVQKTRTIAGFDLSDDISSSDLLIALGLEFTNVEIDED